MTNQDPQLKYGTTGDPILVPSSLLVYRRFSLAANGSLVSIAASVEAFNRQHRTHKDGVFTAFCSTSLARQQGLSKHSSPHVKCSCGFYGHYSPLVNFFPNSWSFHDFSYGKKDPWGMIFGVVEMSGKVICGEIGVRAEKMRIRALSFDWEMHIIQHAPGFVVDRWTEYLVEKNSGWDIGAQVYEDKWALLHDFPQPDLSALLPRPESKVQVKWPFDSVFPFLNET